MRALGQRIKALRVERDWTLEQTSERCQLDLKHLQKIQAGDLNVSLVTLLRIAHGFGISITALFSTGEQPAARKRR